MASAQPGGTDHSGQAVKVEDTFTLLEADELTVVEGIRRLILEHLSSGKEPWLANTLVEYYYRSRSVRAQEILAEIREPLDKMLIEKIQEGLRAVETRIQAMQLLLYIVDRQPPWTHRLLDRPFFPALLKCLKNEVDIPILMTGVMVLVILLPVVPVSIEPYLHDVFDIFARIAGLIIKKPANSPDTYMLHLSIGVYVLFLRLYGMFPCNFLSFLRVHYAKKENLMVYNDIIAPILEKVRFHPYLVSGTKDGETSKSRWRKVEPQDIVVNCAKLSLDPIEGTVEDLQCPIIPRPPPEIKTIMKPASKQQRPQDKPWQEKMEMVSEMFPVVIDPASYGFSPSQLLGLSTPPTSQRATPATSFNDQSTSLQQSTGGTVSASPQIVTPTPEAMPVVMEDAERGQVQSSRNTPNTPRPGPKTTPVCLNRTQGSSAFTSPFSFRAPVSSQPTSVGPSPMRPNLSSDSLNSQLTDSGAARTLLFDRIPESKDEVVPKHIEKRLEKDSTGAGAAGPVPMESLPAIVRTLSSQDSDPLDQEVCRITEVEEQLESSSDFGAPEDATSASAAKHLKTADSVIQFMKKVNRIRFNSLTSHNSEPLMYSVEKHARPGRARSCPPLRRKPLVSDPQLTPFPNNSAHFANSKLDTVSESAVAIHTRNDTGGETSFLSTQLSQDFSKSFGGSKDGSEASSSGQTRTCMCQCGKEGEITLLRHLEQFASVWQCMLAPVKVAVCRHCQQALVIAEGAEQGDQHHGTAKPEGATESWIRLPAAEQALYSMLSPPELLDRHLMQGSDLHAKELAHIPLTSRDNVSWTHFGGGPPVDEINILRGEIHLLSNQVMYERHKRSNHAMRNRRLLRRIAYVASLEEQVQALTRHLVEQGKDVQSLQVSLKLLQDHNHHLQQQKDSDEYEKLVDFKTTIQQNKDLLEANMELKNLLLTQKAENDELKRELQQVRAKSFELEKDNDMMRTEMASVHKWKSQVVQLQKERLLMGEAQERLQHHLDQHQRLGQENSALATNMLLEALKAEIAELKKDKACNAMTLEATKCRVLDLEEFAKTKELATGEIKNNFEAAKATHAEELRSVEEKYLSMLHVSQQKEAHILKLQAENDCLQQKLASFQLQASRRCNYRGDSPKAGAAASQKSSPSRSESEPMREPPEGKTTTEEENLDVVPDRHDPRRVSQMSKDSGRGSMLTSGQVSKSGSVAESATPPMKRDISSGSLPSVPVKVGDIASESTPTAVLPTGTEISESKGKAGSMEQQADAASESSEGPHGLVESHAMLYTDSEDNGSYSSNSNLTTDSGVYSKVEHAQ